MNEGSHNPSHIMIEEGRKEMLHLFQPNLIDGHEVSKSACSCGRPTTCDFDTFGFGLL